jgi:hypothetical protein
VSEERRGGTVRQRTTRDGGRVDFYRAACESCEARGPEAGSAREARRLAALAGWFCEKKRMNSGFGQSPRVTVRCPIHR